MGRHPADELRRPPSHGFTLIELVIVVALISLVLASAGTAFISLSSTTNRGSAMVVDEQAVSGAMAQLGRDIRSTHSILFPTDVVSNNTVSATQDEVILNVNDPSGATTEVEWLYDPIAATLTREVPDSNGNFAAAGPILTRVANSSAQPVFTYLDAEGLSENGAGASSVKNIEECTTRISVQIVESPSGVTGVSNYTSTEDVALTDQTAIVSQPGNGQC